MAQNPLVSVVIPNYNYRRYLPERLASIFAQTYSNLEVIFLDDASTDDSVAYVRSLKTPRPLRVVLNETNSGNPFLQWRKGLGESRGDYVWIAEADDSCRPDLVEKLVAKALRHPSAGVVYAQSMAVDETGREIGSLLENTDDLDAERWRTDYFASGRDEAAMYLINRNTIPNASACLFLKRALETADLAGNGLRLCGDWLAYAQIFRTFDVAYVAEHLNYYRRHPAAVRANADRQGWGLREMVGVQTYIKENFAVSPETYESVCQSNFRKFTHFIAHQTTGRAVFEDESIPALAARFDPLFNLRMLAVDHQNPAWVEVAHDLSPRFFKRVFQRLADRFFNGNSKRRLSYPVGRWTKLRVGPCRGDVRIDPLVRPGLVALRRIRIIERRTHSPLWEASTAEAYRRIELAGHAQRIGSSDALEIYAWDHHPSVHLRLPDNITAGPDFDVEFEIRAASLSDVLPITPKPDVRANPANHP